MKSKGYCRKTKVITYLGSGALAAKTLDLAVTVNLVVLEDGELGLLVLVLDLLGGGVDLLLALLTTTTQAEDEVKGRLLLDVVVRKSAAILELLTSEDQALLVGGNTLLVWCGVSLCCLFFSSRLCDRCSRISAGLTLDLGLDIVNGVGGLHLKGDSLTRKGLDEDLHLDEGLRTKCQWDARDENVGDRERMDRMLVAHAHHIAICLYRTKTHLDSRVFLNLARLKKIVVRGSRLVIKIVVRSRGWVVYQK